MTIPKYLIKLLPHFLLFVILLVDLPSFAQSVLSGTVTDEKGEPLPFATLYVNNTTQGTTTNVEGHYALPLDPGQYQLVFQYVGYEKKVIDVVISKESHILNVTLSSEALQLKEVVIKANGEDPAYPVIRAAIAKRKYHLEEVQAYKCRVYIKGLQELKSRPDKFLGYTVPVDTGIVYLSESISELSVERPDKIKEVMISSKVSGNISNFSYNQGSQMLFSFYDNLLQVVGISERSFVSPIASNAMMFYDYQLVGVIQDQGRMINKIKVIPKRKNDPVFQGHIYIIEDLWKVHSVDLVLTKEHQVEFLDRLKIHQVYAPVEHGIWMMISQTFNYELDAFGFKGEGNFTGVHSNYQIEPNVPLINAERKKNGQDLLVPQPKLFPERYFTNEILTIDREADKKSDEYWQRIRPVPLTKMEMEDYQKNDSLKALYESEAYMDSVDKYVNKVSMGNILYSGYTHQNSKKELYYDFYPLTQTLLYNTVEGAAINFKMRRNQYRDKIIKHRISGEARYGFSSEDFYARIWTDIYTDPMKSTRYTIGGGRYVYQLNEDDPILPLVNTLETLILGNNWIKLYDKTYAEFIYRNEPINGFRILSGLNYSQRKMLSNTTDYSFFDNQSFTSNQPDNLELDDTSFETHQALKLWIKLRFDIKKQYINRPDGKFTMPSKYPRIEVYYHKGIPVGPLEVDYDHLMAGIMGEVTLGLAGTSEYTALAGTFLRKDSLTFLDYAHFNTNQSVVGTFSQYSYELLDYYLFSTTSRYFTVHYRHHFNGFIINKLPLLRKTKVQAVASLSYLNTITSGHYFEYGIGLEHIFKLLRCGIYTATKGGSPYATGFRFGLGF